MEKDFNHDPLPHAAKVPDVQYLVGELKTCIPAAAAWPQQADDIRYCRWPGQHSDGRKHNDGDVEAFPWDNASDTRTMTADTVINELAGVLLSAFWRSAVQPKATDTSAGGYAVALIDHYVNGPLRALLTREVELAAQYREHYGWVALHPFWETRTALRRETITLPLLAAFAMTVAPRNPDMGFEDLPLMIADPSLEEPATTAVRALYDLYARQQLDAKASSTVDYDLPTLKPSTARRAVRDLREKGEASVPMPYVSINEPRIYALKPFDEVFVPGDTTDLENARVIFQREWLNEAEVRARGRDEGWNESWVEEAVLQKGKTSAFWNLYEGQHTGRIRDALARGHNASLTQSAAAGHNYIEVFHAVYRAVDDDGVPGIYCTTFLAAAPNKGEKPSYAKHELLDYPQAEYPYIIGCREHTTRAVTASRGVVDIVSTWQNEVKALRDGIIDRTSITVMPPVNMPVGASNPLGIKYRFGPAVRNAVSPGREPKFMDMPPATGLQEGTVALDRIDAVIANYFGLLHPAVPPPRVQAMQAKLVHGFLVLWSKAFQQIAALAQRYLSDAEFAEITGAPAGWLEENRHRFGSLSVELSFDVRELDSELTKLRIEAMNQLVLPADVAGVVNRAKWVELQVRAINPDWAKELIVPQVEASQALFKQVKDDLAQMFLGNEAQYVENDPTAPTKLQYVQQIVGANPNYQQALMQKGRFAELMEKYVKNLNFSQQQQQNKQIGRIGVSPEGVPA